jgi:hypothetical protein
MHSDHYVEAGSEQTVTLQPHFHIDIYVINFDKEYEITFDRVRLFVQVYQCHVEALICLVSKICFPTEM